MFFMNCLSSFLRSVLPPKPQSSGSRTTTHEHCTFVRNETKYLLDIWINGGGPVARVPPHESRPLSLKHVDPKTTRGICKWSATTSSEFITFPLASGDLPSSSFNPVNTVITVSGAYEIETLTLIVAAQRRIRERRRARERAEAARRRLAIVKIQALARGKMARRPSQCFVCADEMPFAWMVSTVPQARCHRTCRSCAEAYVNHSIEDGKLYVRCPGEGCSHLMDVDLFASKAAKLKHRANMRASHHRRLEGEDDPAFRSFCREHTRMCPTCGVLIFRYAGCDHMSCRCGAQFDWRAEEARVQASKDSSLSTGSSVQAGLRAFRERAENGHCFDCGALHPQWVSTSMGTVFCIECSGQHRQLGVSLSRVRSMALDRFSLEEVTLLLQAGGNAALASFLEDRGESWDGLTIAQRYSSTAAAEYRRRLEGLQTELSDDLAAAGGAPSSATQTSEVADELLARQLRQRAPDGERARASLGWRGQQARTGVGVHAVQAAATTLAGVDERMAHMLQGLERLVMMGFDHGPAEAALEAHGGDVGRAALSLVA